MLIFFCSQHIHYPPPLSRPAFPTPQSVEDVAVKGYQVGGLLPCTLKGSRCSARPPLLFLATPTQKTHTHPLEGGGDGGAAGGWVEENVRRTHARAHFGAEIGREVRARHVEAAHFCSRMVFGGGSAPARRTTTATLMTQSRVIVSRCRRPSPFGRILHAHFAQARAANKLHSRHKERARGISRKANKNRFEKTH